LTHPTPAQVGYTLQTVAHLTRADATAYQLIERWAWLFAVIAYATHQAQEGAAYGNGQADIRTLLQRGGDPVLGRLADDTWPTHIRDPELAWLAKLHTSAVGRLGYHADRLERDLHAFIQQLERQAG
jgi:hypothetical protein